MCIKNKNYMENWLFWGLNLGNLKQCMMIMLVLTSSSSAWTLCSLLHISSLINICNFYSFWATGMVLTSKWGRILQEIHCQCQIWLKWSAAGRRPANFHKRNYLLSVNTTDFEKTTIQAHIVQCYLYWCYLDDDFHMIYKFHGEIIYGGTRQIEDMQYNNRMEHGEIIYGGTRRIEDDRSATFSEYIFLFPACFMISHWLSKNAELNSVF